MDLASIIGVTASSAPLLKLLGGGVLMVNGMIQGIRRIDETTQHLASELDAFQLSLGIFEEELARNSTNPAVRQFWNPVKLDGLLVNAAKTFSRLEDIYGEISRQRSPGLRKVREYLRTIHRQEELQHLKARIRTYTSALNIPVVLFAIQGIRASPSAFDQSISQETLARRINQLEQRIESLPLDIQHDIADNLTHLESSINEISLGEPEARNEAIPNLQANLEAVTTSLGELLGNRISQLEENISSISNDLRSFVVQRTGPSASANASTDEVVSRDSEELVEIARGIASRASTVTHSTRSITTLSTHSTARPADEDRNGTPPSSAPSFVDPDGARPSSVVMDSLSVIGVPISSNRREGIRTWISDTGRHSVQTNSQRARSPVNVNDSIPPGGGALTESEILFTPPPSTIVGPQDDDIEVEIARRRWNLAQSLLVEGKNEAAVPHLQRVLLDLEGLRIRPDRWNRTDIQFLLAKAMMETPRRSEADGLFKAVYESGDSNPLKRASAAHFLASFRHKTGEDKDLQEAKSLCLESIRMRKKYLGSDDPATQSSIALIRDICQMADDPDGAIWNSMLPPSFQMSAPKYYSRVITTFPARIIAVRVTTQGKLVSYSCDGARSVIRLFDTSTWKIISKVEFSEPVAAATVGSDGMFHILTIGPQENLVKHMPLMAYYWSTAATSSSSSLSVSKNAIPGFQLPKNCVELSHDGSTLLWQHPNALGSTKWGTWQHSNAQICEYSITPEETALAVSDDKILAARGIGDTVFIWSVSGGTLAGPFTMGSQVKCLTFSPTVSILIVYCKDGSLYSLDISNGHRKTIFREHTDITLLVVARDEKLLATVKKEKIELWRYPTGELMRQLQAGTSDITAMTFSPDCKALCSGSADGILRVWNLRHIPE